MNIQRNSQHTRRTFLAGAMTMILTGILAPSLMAAPKPPVGNSGGKEVATFAAGCFWSMEAIFNQLKGVEKAESGYAGGKLAKPTYEQVETGTTGHAETLNITFDPKVITYRDLLEVLLTVRDPTSINRQGNDEGPQYRSIIFYRTPEQKQAAEETIQKFTQKKVWSNPIVVKVQPFTTFYRAEDYHTNYYNLHPDQGYCKNVIAPEIAEFRQKFKSKLKK